MTIDKKKIAGIVLAILAGLAAAGIVLWQPWNRTEPETKDPVQRVDEDIAPEAPEEKGPSLTVGGKEIACTIYEGDGWSIYVPEDWELVKNTYSSGAEGVILWPDKEGKPDASVLVTTDRRAGLYDGEFVSVFPTAGVERVMTRLFYHSGSDLAGEVWTQAADGDWKELGPVMAAVAGTYTVHSEKPFEGWYPMAAEPEWQVAEGLTVLFMDKDGYIVDEDAQKAAAAFFDGLDAEVTRHLTGNLRLEELTWAASYTGLAEDATVDVFSVWPEAEVKAGEGNAIPLDGGADVRGGWYKPGQRLDIAVVNDGAEVKGVYPITGNDAVGLPGWASAFEGK